MRTDNSCFRARKQVTLLAALALVVVSAAQSAEPRLPGGRILKVGHSSPLKSIAAAADLVRDGDTVEVEEGVYTGDVAVWSRNNVTVRAKGRVRIDAGGKAAEGKGIWVVRAKNFAVEGISFTNSRVADGNGAGIRFEVGSMTVRNCSFTDNENGILTGNDPNSELVIEDSEFGRNGAGDGQSHNLYAGALRKLVVKGSYFHHGKSGHLLKSRARETQVLYSRLTDEEGGTASYELEFPAGGVALVLGNVIQQVRTTENGTVVSFGAEGYRWPENRLILAYNTIVNDRPEGGRYVATRPGASGVSLINNVFVGKGSIEAPHATSTGNVTLAEKDFVMPARLDYHLKATSRAAGSAVATPDSVDDVPLRPAFEYVYPVGARPIPPTIRLSPGAFQVISQP